jgi:hypothetical protein
MSAPQRPTEAPVVLPAATRDFIVQALGEASQALSRTHGLRATRHILVQEGMQLTQDNSFRINHLNHVLLMNLVRRILREPDSSRDPGLDD